MIRGRWFVDPDLGWGWRGLGRVLDEAVRMGKVCGVRDGLAMSQDAWRLTVMQGRKSEEADAGVVVLFVVPAEQFDGKSTGVLERAEAGWEARSILQGAELAFRVGLSLET